MGHNPRFCTIQGVCFPSQPRVESGARCPRWVRLQPVLLSLQVNSWTPVASMLSRRSSAGVAVLEGALYVAGGNDGTSCLNSVERYSTKAGAWESVAPMNVRRCVRPGAGGGWLCHYVQFIVAPGVVRTAPHQYSRSLGSSWASGALSDACPHGSSLYAPRPVSWPAPRAYPCLSNSPGARMTSWPWTAGSTLSGATMAAPASTP